MLILGSWVGKTLGTAYSELLSLTEILCTFITDSDSTQVLWKEEETFIQFENQR